MDSETVSQIVSKAEAINILGCTPEQFVKYVAQGMPGISKGRGRKYDIVACKEWLATPVTLRSLHPPRQPRIPASPKPSIPHICSCGNVIVRKSRMGRWPTKCTICAEAHTTQRAKGTSGRGWPHDGRNHKNGVANEQDTVPFLEEHGREALNLDPTPFNVLPRGGTWNKADVVVQQGNQEYPISAKNKKEGLSGNIDYTDTSKAISDSLDRKLPAMEPLRKLKEEIAERCRTQSIAERQADFESFKEHVKDVCLTVLSNIPSDVWREWLETYLIVPNLPMWEIIYDRKHGIRYVWEFRNHPVIRLLSEGYIPIPEVRRADSHMSATLIFVKGQDEIDVGIRVRFHPNNGFHALLKLPTVKSKTSIFCLKFQQDDIPRLLQNVPYKEFPNHS